MDFYADHRYVRANLRGFCVIIFCFIVMTVLGFVMRAKTLGLEDESIYAQALADWDQRSWVDFTWSQAESCPDGFEAVGATWQGTMNVNLTAYGLRVDLWGFTEDYGYAIDYPA